jgi:hypothetical protein
MNYIAKRDLTPDEEFRGKHCQGIPNIVRRGQVYKLSSQEYEKYAEHFDLMVVTKEAKEPKK